MRQIVSTLVGIFMSLYFMFFYYPLISTSHTNFNLLVNSTDPVIAQSYTLGSGFYQVIPAIPLLVGAFTIINNALKRDAGD